MDVAKVAVHHQVDADVDEQRRQPPRVGVLVGGRHDEPHDRKEVKKEGESEATYEGHDS